MRGGALFSTTTAVAAVVLIFIFVNFTKLTEIITATKMSIGINRTQCAPLRTTNTATVTDLVVQVSNATVEILNDTNIYINCKEEEREPKQLRILLGILTKADSYERRHLLRMVYGVQKLENATVDVRFVLCALDKEDQKFLVALEILSFKDVIVLDCEENMNKGKTFSYLSSLPSLLRSKGLPDTYYDYVMKADDDIFFKLDMLAGALAATPREDSYYGFVIPCESGDPFGRHYMSGMGYAMSWDLVRWISESPITRNRSMGTEDQLVGEWFRAGGKAKNRFNSKPRMYDFPGEVPKCSHELTPDTVGVHKLKSRDRWFKVILFFNLTAPVFASPSTLYRLD